jgi:hypothetical protein
MEREAILIRKSRPVIEGAGVRLRRAIGLGDPSEADPFLLLDDFRSQKREDFMRGFPWHPHRGIETVTYVLKGRVRHEDSIGNAGTIGQGDLQWMTAGKGILHQEMPEGDALEGFQLWCNLPSSKKMIPPRYQEIKASEIAERRLADGSAIRVASGSWDGAQGPIDGIAAEPEFFDASLAPGARVTRRMEPERFAFAYVIGGRGHFGGSCAVGDGELVFLGPGDRLSISAEGGEEAFRFILCSGMRIGEPIAWGGPIVMNTREELELAFRQLEEGSFIEPSLDAPTRARL